MGSVVLSVSPHTCDPMNEQLTQGSSLNAYPQLQFVIIINPNSGPGSAPWWPNEDYVREVPKLNRFANVQTVGYVRTDYRRRPLHEVFQDIEKYERWSLDFGYKDLFVSGIFFDETPNVYSEECHAYLCAVTSRVKQSGSFSSDESILVRSSTFMEHRVIAH